MASQYNVAFARSSELEKKNDAAGTLYLGFMYEQGLGVAVDLEKAEALFKKAAALGSVDAIYYLARFYRDRSDFKRSFELFQEAAEKGDVASGGWVGRSYLLGEGVPKNLDLAWKYLKRASDAGHLYARSTLNSAMMRGSFGLGNRLPGFFGFVWSIFLAVKESYSNPDSERFR